MWEHRVVPASLSSIARAGSAPCGDALRLCERRHLQRSTPGMREPVARDRDEPPRRGQPSHHGSQREMRRTASARHYRGRVKTRRYFGEITATRGPTRGSPGPGGPSWSRHLCSPIGENQPGSSNVVQERPISARPPPGSSKNSRTLLGPPPFTGTAFWHKPGAKRRRFSNVALQSHRPCPLRGLVESRNGRRR